LIFGNVRMLMKMRRMGRQLVGVPVNVKSDRRVKGRGMDCLGGRWRIVCPRPSK
jgi:hypothetical protein